ncbi:unnamed protein product [Urochloa humidicola]
MASRFVLRLGGGAAARSARERCHLLLAGKTCRAPSPAGGAQGASSGFGVPGVKGRWMSDYTNFNGRLMEAEKRIAEFGGRLQSVEKAWVLAEKEVKLAVRRAEAAERRAEAAERRAELAEWRAQMAEERTAKVERTVYILQNRVEYLSLLSSSQFGYMLRLQGDMAQKLQVNFAMSHLSHWMLSQEMAVITDHISDIKAGYQKEVLKVKNALSVTAWRIVVVLLGAFGAVIMFILPYIISDIKGDIMKDVTEVVKESIAPINNEVSELKNAKAKKWF